jgi:transcription elongation factor GreA
MQEKPVLLSQEGLSRLSAELDQLRRVRRAEIAERIRQAKEYGDIMENSEYEDAKNEQAMVEGRILTVEAMVRNAVIIPDEHDKKVVGVGSTVKLLDSSGDEFDYTIVGSAESDPGQGRISNESPVGKALLGRKAGESVEVAVPSGKQTLKIRAIA